jgi:hypothetical protein
MPRETKTPIVLLALSAAAVATSIDVRPDQVAAAIATGALPVHCLGVRRRILVKDVLAWIERDWKKPTPRKKRNVPCL